MLHVLLLILKIIGITLLVILGLLLLAVILILFVPLRYKGEGSIDRISDGEESSYDYSLRAGFTWLLHIINVKVVYSGELGYRVRIFIFTLLSGGCLEKKKAGRFDVDEDSGDIRQPEEGNADIATDASGTVERENHGEADGSSAAGFDRASKASGTAESGNSGDTDGIAKTSGTAESGNSGDTDGIAKTSGTAESGNSGDPDETTEASGAAEKENAGAADQASKVSKASRTKKRKNTAGTDSPEKNEGSETKNKQGVVDKIKKYYNDLNSITQDPKSVRAYELVKRQTVRLLNAIKPRRISGNASYGFENPAVTGYITAFFAANYSRVRDLEIDPHFEDEILKAALKLKGRIYMITMLCIGAKLYFNRDLKATLKKVRKLRKEEVD